MVTVNAEFVITVGATIGATILSVVVVSWVEMAAFKLLWLG